MAHYPSDIRRQRISREKDGILALEQRIEEARRTRDAAVHTFERAQAVMHDAVEEFSALCARCDTARDELSELRLSYRRDLMETMPLDVLGCIFEEVAALPPGFIECLQFNNSYLRYSTLAPFALAAVCRRWRAQALSQPLLWTYISAPTCMDDAGIRQHRQRINRVLQRSKSCPLDILISWAECGRDDRWDASPSLETILKPLLSCAPRWRTFQLVLPDGVGKAEYTYALNGPLPLLEYFRFISIEKNNDYPASSGFPFAPKLREMTVWGPNPVHLTPLALPSLRSLRLWFHLRLEQILPLISTVSPTLEDLAIGLGIDAVPLSDAQLELPKLTTLTLDIPQGLGRAYQQLRCMRLPALQHLLLPENSIFADLSLLLDQMATSTGARTLTLGGAIEPQHIDVLERLTSIRTLIFHDFNEDGEPGNAYKVADAFFATLAERADVWPRLERVELRDTGVLELGAGTGVLSFVRSRTRRAADACRLRAFEVAGEWPEWLTAEVARLLRDEKML